MTTTTATPPQLLITPPAPPPPPPPPPPPQSQGTFPSKPSQSHGMRANARKPHPAPPNHGPGNPNSIEFRGIPSPPPSLPIARNAARVSSAAAPGSLSAATTAAKSANKEDGAGIRIRHANGRSNGADANNLSRRHFNKSRETDYRAAFSPNLKSYLNGSSAENRSVPEEDRPGRDSDEENRIYDGNNSHSANASFFENSSDSHSNYNIHSIDNANANDTKIQTNKPNLTDLLFSPTAEKEQRQRNNDDKIIHSIFSPQFQRQGRYEKAHEQECGHFRGATRESRNGHDGIGMTSLQPLTLDDSATMGMTAILGNRDGGIVEMDGTWDYYGGDSTIATWDEDGGVGFDIGLDAAYDGAPNGKPLFEEVNGTFAAGEKSDDSGFTGGIFDIHMHSSLPSSTNQCHQPVLQSMAHVTDASPLSTEIPSESFEETKTVALKSHALSKTPISKKSTSSTGVSNTPGSADSEEFYTPTSKELHANKTPSSKKTPKGRVSVSFSFGEDNAVTPKSIDWRNESELDPVGEEGDDDVHGNDESDDLDELRNRSTLEPNSRYNGFGGVSIHYDDNRKDGRYDWDGKDDGRNHNGSIVSDLDDESAVFQTPKQYGSDWNVDRDQDRVASEQGSREGDEDVLGDVAVYGQRCGNDAFSPLAVQPKPIIQHSASDEKRKPACHGSKFDNLTNARTTTGRSTASSTSFRFRDASIHLSPIPSSADQNVSSHTIDSVESMSPPSEIKSLMQIPLRAKNARGSYDSLAHVTQSRLLFPDANAGRGETVDGAQQLGPASTLGFSESDSRRAATASLLSENISGTLQRTRSGTSTTNDESLVSGNHLGVSLFHKSASSSSTARNPSTKATTTSPTQEVRSLSTMSSFEKSSSQDTNDSISTLPSNISADFLKQCECADTLNEIVSKLSHKRGKYPNLLRLAEHRLKKVRSKQSDAAPILHHLASGEKKRYVQRESGNVQRNPSPSSRADAGGLDSSARDSPPTASKLRMISSPESGYDSGSVKSVSRSDLKQQAIPAVVKGAPLPHSPSLLHNEMSLTLESSSLDMNLSESLVLDEETVFWKHENGHEEETVDLALREEGSLTEYTSEDRTRVKESYEELKEKLAHTLQSHDALTREVDSLVERYENKQRQFEHQVSKLDNENDWLRKEVQNLQENLENANEDAKNATHRLQVELEHIKQKYSNLSLNQCDLERELKQVRFEHDKAKVEVARLQLLLQESQESKHQTENANTEMKEKLKEAYVSRDAFAKELAVSAKDLGETTALKQVAENECRQLKVMNKQLENKTNHMSAALREMHQKLADSRSYIDNLHSLINGNQVPSVEVESQLSRKVPDLNESNQKFSNLNDNYRQPNQRMNDYSGDKAVESIHDAARTSRITRPISPSTEKNNENIKPRLLGGQANTGKQFHRIEAIKSFGGKKGLLEQYNSNRARRFGDKAINLQNQNR